MERWDVVMPVEHSSGDMRRSIMEVICPANVDNLGKPMVGHHLHITEGGHSIASEAHDKIKKEDSKCLSTSTSNSFLCAADIF